MTEASVQVDLCNVDKQDNRIEDVQLELRDCQQLLRQRDPALVTGLAPHHWLPVEVMQHIFCLSASRVFLPLNRAEPPPQLVVSHVCSAWRQLALGSGALWNNISITKLDALVLEVAQTWLGRANNTEASVRLSAIDYPLNGNFEDIFRSLFCPLRLKRLDLRLSSVHMAQLGNLSMEAFPQIEEIRVVLDGHKHSSPVAPSSFLAHIQYLLCASGPCSELLHRGLFPINHLRQLELQCVELTSAQCFTILSEATSLEACRFLWYWECDILGLEPEQKFKDVVLPNMKVFSLDFQSQRGGSNVFEFMTRHVVLPNLTALSIRYRGLTGGMISMISERFNLSGLEELNLRKTGSMLASDVLAYTHTLRRATLSKNILIDEMILDALSMGKYAPLLESIKSNDMCDAKAVFRMIETRWKNSIEGGRVPSNVCAQTIAPLRYVNFRSPESLEAYGEEWETTKKLGSCVVMNDYLNRHRFRHHTGLEDMPDIWDKFSLPLRD